MRKYGNNKPKEDESTRITERVVQYVDDPKNSSALAKIHEMSDKAKRTGKSPAQLQNRRSLKNSEQFEKKQDDINYNRRNQHFATVKQENNINLLNNNSNKKVAPPKDTQKDKKEFVWDKSNNRLVEKDKVSNTQSYVSNTQSYSNNTRSQVNNPRSQVNNTRSQVNNTRSQKVETKVETQTKRKYQNDTEPIREDQDKEDKGEIIDKLRQYKKNRENEGKKKRIKVQVPKGNEKFSEIVYEKQVLPEEDEDEEDFKESSGSKNTKFYKKIVKNAPGSKTVITKKVIEENVDQQFDNNLKFNDSDDEDIRKELRKLKLDPSQISKDNVQVKIITEEYDENGNKIYSKEYTTNKLPKGLKGNDEIMDEFAKFEDEFDE